MILPSIWVLRRGVAVLLTMLLFAAFPCIGAAEDAISRPSQELVEKWHLAPFYQKHLSIEGFSILSSEKVSDFALREAAFLLRKTLGHRPDILRALAENQVRLVVMAPTEMTTDVPEHSDLQPASFWNRRARGLGPTRERPAVSCGEENLLCLAGDPYSKENILIHEFAHAVHLMALNKIDPTFDGRLKAAYTSAMAADLWKGTYSATNKEEYWAEGVQCWFDCARAHDREHGDIDTREKIKAYDPALASLIAEVYGDTAWRYAKPAARSAEGRTHLAGFDVAQAPRFVWPAKATASAQPEIWLAPVDPVKRAGWPEAGKSDFLDLFAPDAEWKTAVSHVQVFEIYPQFLYRSSDEMLRTVIEGLKSRHIALAVSYGLMHRPKGEPMHEGYGAEIATRDIARLQRLGADVRYVVADEPLLFGHFYWGEGATPRSIADCAKDVASTAREFRDAFPNARIGMDDPIMLYRTEEWEPAMREFLEVYQKEFGEPMAFVRLECASFPIREWLPRYRAAEPFLRSMGVAFGELITGDSSDTSDAQWVEKAEERYVTWESDGRSAPGQAVFQTWMPRPARILPETAPDTLTHLLNGYFRERTALDFKRAGEVLRGELTDASGHPIAGATVTCSYLPGFLDPVMTDRVVAGTVPAEAHFVQVGLRIGMEGSRAGVAELTMGPTHYHEEGDGGLTALFAFEQGLKGWGTKGTAVANPTATIPAEHARLEIAASSGQTFLLNSKIVPATAGRAFHCAFDVGVYPTTETGYLVVFFFDAARKVIARLQEPLVPDEARAGQNATTDAAGRFELPLATAELKTAREYRLSYPGDEHRRPAFAVLK